MVDPGTAILVSSAILGAGQAGGGALSARQQKQAAKLRAKETKRETLASMLNDALAGSAELTAQGMGSRSRLGKRRTQSYNDTADLVRGAFNI